MPSLRQHPGPNMHVVTDVLQAVSTVIWTPHPLMSCLVYAGSEAIMSHFDPSKEMASGRSHRNRSGTSLCT